jgi:drug/metabolite transporter (DMT)-like permease
MPVYELAAVGAATCWALTGIIATGPAGHLGAWAFNWIRQVSVTVLLAILMLVTGLWHQLSVANVGPLALSGLMGIFVGDTLLFATLNRVGPRRAGVLFALNAPMAALLGFVLLGERLPVQVILGIALTVCGVVLAIIFGKRRDQIHAWEAIKGPLWTGILFGLGAAAGQAVGAVIAKPVMASGVDPFLASMVRVGVAAFCLTVLMALPIQAAKPKAPVTLGVAALTVLAGVLGLGVGMTLLLFALSGGNVGVVSTLSATSPVIILPML